MNTNKYIVKFFQDGKIHFHNTPFISPESNLIHDYLPLFDDLESIDGIIGETINYYHCEINESIYTFELKCESVSNKNQKEYELSITDKTQISKLIESERTEKNRRQIELDILKNDLARVKTKLNDLEIFIEEDIFSNILIPIQQINSFLNHILAKNLSVEVGQSVKAHLIKSQNETNKIDQIAKSLNEYNNLSRLESFEKSHYFDLLELLDQAISNYQKDHKISCEIEIPNAISIYVNRHHFVSLFEKLFYFLKSHSKEILSLNIFSEIVEKQVLSVEFIMDLEKLSSSVLEIQKDFYQKSYFVVYKLIQLYNGEVNFKIRNKKIYFNIKFQSILPRLSKEVA